MDQHVNWLHFLSSFIFGSGLLSIEKDRKVIPDPIDDRKFQEWKESGKSGQSLLYHVYSCGFSIKEIFATAVWRLVSWGYNRSSSPEKERQRWAPSTCTVCDTLWRPFPVFLLAARRGIQFTAVASPLKKSLPQLLIEGLRPGDRSL